jgi:hypothetical protein
METLFEYTDRMKEEREKRAANIKTLQGQFDDVTIILKLIPKGEYRELQVARNKAKEIRLMLEDEKKAYEATFQPMENAVSKLVDKMNL